jgi:predicted outer membrane repeat protein
VIEAGLHEEIALGPDLASDYNSQIQLKPGQKVTIFGNGAVLDAQQKGRFFELKGPGTLTLQNLTLTNGLSDEGGAILMEGGTVVMDDVKAINNRARECGGCLYNLVGATHVRRTTFEGNSAFDGGAISNQLKGVLTVDSSTFVSNLGDDGENGGAISNEGHADIKGTLFQNNTADDVSQPCSFDRHWGPLTSMQLFKGGAISNGPHAVLHLQGSRFIKNVAGGQVRDWLSQAHAGLTTALVDARVVLSTIPLGARPSLTAAVNSRATHAALRHV